MVDSNTETQRPENVEAKKRPSKATLPGRIFLVALVLVLALELHARHYYGKSLEAIREAVTTHRDEGLPLADVEPLIQGFPQQWDRYNLHKPVRLVSYFSLFKTYVIRLELTEDRQIDVLQTGAWEEGRYSIEPVTIQQQLEATGYEIPRKQGYVRQQGHIVQLNTAKRKQQRHYYGFIPDLYQEIFRQAFLMTARDELQLPTRDVNMGEELLMIKRPDPDTEPFNLQIANRPNRDGFTLYFGRGTPDLIEDLEELSVELPEGAPVEEIVSAAEKLSRTTFVEWLRKLKIAGQANRIVESGEVPAGAAESGSIMNTVSQLVTLRLLHQSIRTDGESPERLVALSGAYAIYGELTDHFWHPMSDAARARALLYSERLIQRSPESEMALAGRARVRALAGLHSGAIADIDRLRELDGTEDVNQSPVYSDWLSPIEASARGDLAKLRQQSQAEGITVTAPLAALLHLQHSFAAGNRRNIADSANQMLALQPAQALAFERLVTHARRGTEQTRLGSILVSTPQTFGEYSRRLVGLSEPVQRIMNETPDSIESSGEWCASLYRELKLFDEQLADHQVTDTFEPSIRTISALLRETLFLQAVRSFQYYDRNFDHASPSRTERYCQRLPFITDHDFEDWFLGFQSDTNESWSAVRRSWMARSEFKYWSRNCMPLVYQWKTRKITDRAADVSPDSYFKDPPAVFGELAQQVQCGTSAEKRRLAAGQLMAVSPDSEAAVAAAVLNDWENFKDRAIGWEEQFGNSAVVQASLGEAWARAMRYVEAERCLKRSLALQPASSVSKILAVCYLDQGQADRWLAQMEHAAELEASELVTKHRRPDGILQEIARGLLQQGKPRLALEYANRATDAGIVFCPSVAADCYEAMGDFVNAELEIQKRRETYRHLLDWYFWCRRTGHGDVKAAAETAAAAEIEAIRVSQHSDDCVRSMVHSRVSGDLEGAVDRLTLGHFHGQGKGPWTYLHWELMKLELGKLNRDPYELKNNLTVENNPYRVEKTPDEIRLERFRMGMVHVDGYAQLGRPTDPRAFFVEMRRHLASKDKRAVNPEQLDWIVRIHGSSNSRTTMLYWIGKVLLLDGRKDEAVRYFRLAASSPYTRNYNAILAGYELRQMEIPADPLRPTELDFDEAALIHLYDRATGLKQAGQLNLAVMRCRQIIELSPDWAPAHYLLGQLLQSLGQFDLAAGHFDRALQLEPEVPDVFIARGKLFQELGQYEQALAQYEKALEVDPIRDETHWHLGMIRAAAPVPELRDGAMAMIHAESIDQLVLAHEYDYNKLLAAANAESGDFEAAAEFASKSSYNGAAGFDIRQRQVADYQAGKPYRMKSNSASGTDD